MRSFVVSLAALLLAPLLVAAGVLTSARPPASLAAAEATGAITGQVVWCAPLPVGLADPAESGVAPEPSLPVAPEGELRPEPEPAWPVPGRPWPRPIPAGAVLVAVQGTALAARTDEHGRFRIEGVPVGQYLTVGAGPAAGRSAAIALRPNVYLAAAGAVVDLGQLQLGAPCRYPPVPYAVPGTPPAEGEPEPEEGP